MVLPSNIQPGTTDPVPDGVFLIPLCTTREALTEMIYALDSAYAQTGKFIIIKDFLNALQFIENPMDAICMASEPPAETIVTTERNGDCTRVLIDGVAVTDWICPETKNRPIGGQFTGNLGLTIEEMEEIIMGCINISGSLRWNNGVLEMKDCEGWVAVPGMEAPVMSQGSGAVSSLASGVADWIAGGKQNLSEGQKPVPSDNALYTTTGVKACAKATAIAEVFQQIIQDTADGLGESALSITTLFTTLSAGALMAGSPFAVVLEFATFVVGALAGSGAELFQEHAEETLADEAWSTIICDSIPDMSPIVTVVNITGNLCTEGDVNAVYNQIVAQIPDIDDKVLQTIAHFPLSVIKDRVREKLPNQECGCDEYLPYGYTPPTPEGALHFLQMASAGGAGINSWQLVSGEPLFNQINLTPIGSKSGLAFTSEYVGSGSFYYQGIGILLLVPDNVIITEMDYTIALTGGFDEVKLNFVAFRPGTGWVNGGAVAPNAAGDFIATGHFEGTEGITHLLIQLKGSGVTSSAQPVTLSNLAFTGTIGGEGFIGAALEEPLS